MNILAIDAGNSRIKWGVHAEGAWLSRGVVDTVNASSLGVATADIVPPQRIIVANVAGERVREQLKSVLERFDVTVQWLAASAERCGVRSSYADPAQLGADRWAALIGAHELYGGACVVVTAGTTVTIDALSAEGVFLGGCIVPGVELMQNTLAVSTAQLARRDGDFLFFPDNTADAIVSGAVNAISGAIERIGRYMKEVGEPQPLIVLSGGAAPVLVPRLTGRIEVVGNLVLQGLVHIALSEEGS